MRNLLFIFFICILSASSVFAVTKTSVANGNWSSAATWSPSGVPAATDDVIINTNVVLDQNIDIDPGGSLTINSGRSLIGATFTIDFNGSTTGGSVALLTNRGTLTVGNILEGTECAFSKIDNYGTINVEAANGTTPVLNWRSSDTLYNHSGATLNVLNGLFRSSNQGWTTCNGGNGKPTTINEGYFNVYDAQFHAGSIFMNYLIVNIEPAPAPGLWMGAWEFHNYGCILGGDFEFNSKSNNSGHNESYFHDGSKIYANMSITSASQTITGVDDDGINSNNACTYSPINVTNTGTITGEFNMNDPDGAIPGTVGPNVVEGTNNCGGPACALPCDIAIVPQNLVCLDNGTPGNITDNRIRFNALVTNTNASLTSYNVTINGGTTITPNTNVPYGVTQFTLGPGTAGGGATFTVTVTDSATPGCSQTFQVIDPGNCPPATQCPTPKCGTATIQVNGN